MKNWSRGEAMVRVASVTLCPLYINPGCAEDCAVQDHTCKAVCVKCMIENDWCYVCVI